MPSRYSDDEDDSRSRRRRVDRKEEGESSKTRTRSRSPDRRRRHRSQSSQESNDSGSDSSSSDSDSDSDRHHHSRRASHRHRSSHSKDSDHDREKRKRREDRKRDKKEQRKKEKKERRKREKEEKKLRKKKKSKYTADSYGKHGILTETSKEKDAEFRAWLVEEKMLNPETTTGKQTKELFRTFIEDFNTCTLPHEKYYNMEAWERKADAIRMGETIQDSSGYNFEADLAAHASAYRRENAAAASQNETWMSASQLQELRNVDRERIQSSKMKQMGWEHSKNLGVRYQ